MENEEYLATQMQLMTFANMIRTLKLKDFLSSIEHSEVLTPILHPTLYMAGGQKLQFVKRIALATLDYQKRVNEIMQEAEEKGTLEPNQIELMMRARGEL